MNGLFSISTTLKAISVLFLFTLFMTSCQKGGEPAPVFNNTSGAQLNNPDQKNVDDIVVPGDSGAEGESSEGGSGSDGDGTIVGGGSDDGGGDGDNIVGGGSDDGGGDGDNLVGDGTGSGGIVVGGDGTGL